MLKRLVGVVTVKDGWAVQSIGYHRYLPLGRPEIIVENFDRWQVDEVVLLVIDRTRAGAGPDFALLERIAERRIMSPLTYAGGVRTADDAVAVVKAGADRIAADAVYRSDPLAARAIADAIGRQASIRICPAHIGENGQAYAFDYLSRQSVGPLADAVARHQESFSELFLVDWRNEGGLAAFDPRLVACLGGSAMQIIAFGGISTKAQVAELMAVDTISAVAIGNSLAYRELASRQLLDATDVDRAREISFGERTRGARQW